MIGIVQKYCLVLVSILKYSIGYSDSPMKGYIVGGKFAKSNQFPHAAFLAVDCEFPWICGASVLNQKILLTAAHCLDDIEDSCTITASAGHADLSMTRKRRVKRFIMHERFNAELITNDIALVLLKKSLPLGRDIQRVFLNKFETIQITEAMVAGWGVINDVLKISSTKLKYTVQQIKPVNVCDRVTKMHKGMLCVKSLKRDNRPSQGDSGCALITPKGQQIGLVSFRRSSVPDVVIYTHVPYYLTWIGKNARKLYCRYN